MLINYIFAGKPVLEFQIWGVKEIILSILIFAIGVTIIVLLFMYLKKYTAKHKNYFDLEKTENPLYSNNENSSNNVRGARRDLHGCARSGTLPADGQKRRLQAGDARIHRRPAAAV